MIDFKETKDLQNFTTKESNDETFNFQIVSED